ncbi:MAG: hypothetical protein PUE67_02985 [Oscillospiraceae bacterium]|nr:hypothetical protein [Oscillospiraceae bacterium]
MALDSYLRGTSPVDEMIMSAIDGIMPEKRLFSTISGREAFSKGYNLCVEKSSKSDINSTLIELAFRYIAKILVSAYSNDINCDPLQYSVASRSIENLKWRLSGEYYDELKERFDYGVMRVNDYIETGEDSSENIVQHCWFFAKLDICYRRGAVPSDIGQFFQPATDEEVREVLALATKFRRSFIPSVIKPTSRIIINPQFGFGEYLIGEVDCDMIIDNTIVDLRTDIGHSFPYERVAKSLLYYLLTEINSEFNDTDSAYPIRRLAFYSGRYGETEVLFLEDMDGDELSKALEKIIIATEAKYKIKSQNTEENHTLNQSPKRTERENFLDEYDYRERENYNDGYNRVVKEKNHHIFRKILIFLIIISLLVVVFFYAKEWYTSTYGADYSFSSIIHNLFGWDI